MKAGGVRTGLLIWLLTLLLITLSSLIPSSSIKFLDLARPHLLLGTLAALLYFKHGLRTSIKPRARSKLIDAGLSLLYGVGAFTFSQVAYYVTTVSLPKPLVLEGVEQLNILIPRNVSELLTHIALTWVLFAPIEELIFRGFIHGYIRMELGGRITIVLSSLLFAIAHFNVIQIPVAFVVGVMTASILEKTGKLGNCVMVHATNNTLSLVLVYVF